MLIPFGVFSAGASTGSTFELISSTILGSASTQVNFSSIPSGYKHLQLRITARLTTSSSGVNDIFMRFNGDSANNYARHQLYGYGGTMYSYNAPNISYSHAGWAVIESTQPYIFATSIVDILDAFATTKNKTVRTLTGIPSTGNQLVALSSSFWNSTSAISSIALTETNGDTFSIGSRFSLYGIKG
jgi:hypothetical protein